MLLLQSSENIYGANFSSLSEILGELFRKTYTLQKIFSVIFSKTSYPAGNDELTNYYVTGDDLNLKSICHYSLSVPESVKIKNE